jgi:hypothetical protein
MSRFIISTFHKILFEESKKDEICEVCSMNGEMNYAQLLLRKPEKEAHLEDPAIEGWISLKLIFKKSDGRHGLD